MHCAVSAGDIFIIYTVREGSKHCMISVFKDLKQLLLPGNMLFHGNMDPLLSFINLCMLGGQEDGGDGREREWHFTQLQLPDRSERMLTHLESVLSYLCAI